MNKLKETLQLVLRSQKTNPNYATLDGLGNSLKSGGWMKVALVITASLVTGSVAAWLTFKSNNVSQQRKDILEDVKKLKMLVETNWVQTNKLIASLDMENAIALLQLFPKIDPNEIKDLEQLIKQLQEQRGYNQHFLQQAEQIKQTMDELNLVRRNHLSDVKLNLEKLINNLNLQDQQLKVASSYCKTLLNRKQKRFEPALKAADEWISDLSTYKEMLTNSQHNSSANAVDQLLVNAYNVKAKIHRALAGVDLDQLDYKQLELSKKKL